MIAVVRYDVEQEREPAYCAPRAAFTPREPTFTIDLRVIASGQDFDRFMAMLEQITGQRAPRAVQEAPRLEAP